MSHNTLKGTKAYTIGNLEFDSFASATKWRRQLVEALSPIGVQILSPLDNPFKTFKEESAGHNKKLREMLQDPSKWDDVHKEAQLIRGKDLSLCDSSQFIIGVLNVDKPSFGTVDEIITSKRACKPVFLVIPEKGYSGIPIWLASYFKPNWVYDSIEKVIQELYRINDSPVEELNNKYWKIFK